MSKSIQDYLPIKSKRMVMVNARVPVEVVDQIRRILEKENLSWTDVITACLRHFLDEKVTRK